MNGFKQDIADFLVRETPLSPAEAARLIETPPDPRHGDYAVPCHRLAKALRRPPPEIARELAESFLPTDRLLGVEVAGPYLNFRLNRPRFFAEALEEPEAGTDDGRGRTIVLDYGSPNIAKHLGYHHVPTSCIGFSLKRIFTQLGYETVGINHLGDWGTTHGKLLAAWSRWGEGMDLSVDGVTKLNELYVRFHREGDETEGREWFRRLEEGDPRARRLWEEFRRVSLDEFEEVFGLLGVEFDVTRGESEFLGEVEEVIRRLEEAGLAVVSEGALVVDLSDHDLPPLFLRKADGATVYSTRDLAAAIQRYEAYRFHRCLYVVDMGQSLYFRQLFLVLEKLGLPWASRLEHVGFGLIQLGGKKAGSRAGRVMLLREVLEEAIARIRKVIDEKNPDLPGKEAVARQVGVGAIVFSALASKRVKDTDLEWEDILKFDGHTGPYVQYTHARCASIARRAPERPGEADFARLTLPEEWEIAKLLAVFKDRVRAAGEAAEPSVVAQYLLALSETFSRYYNLGNQDRALKVLAPDPAVAAARLRLVEGVRKVLARGLWLLGIEAPEEM